MILCLNIIVILISAYITMATTTKQNIRGSSVKYMRDKKELNVKLTEDHKEEPIKQNRRLTSTTGVKTVLAVRITVVTNAGTILKNTFDEGQLKHRVFTKNDNWKDNWTLANAMSKCSFGQLEIEPPQCQSKKLCPSGGVVSVKINNNVVYGEKTRHTWAKTIESIKNDAKKELDKKYGNIYDLVDEVMYCIPKIGIWDDGNGSYTAKASGVTLKNGVPNQWTVYDDDACLRSSYQMHEIGHNLDIGHSGIKGGDKRGDQSGVMGYSYGMENGPHMCFNGAANYQLGWFKDRTATLDDPTSNWRGRLIGLVDYKNNDVDVDVLLDIDDGEEFRYIVSFNRKSAFNSGTAFGEDKVLIHKRKRDGGVWSQSWLVATMGEGDERVLHDIYSNEKNEKVKVMVTVKKINLKSPIAFADIKIKYHKDDAPTQSPIVSGMGICGINTLIEKEDCPTEKQELNLRNCKIVAYGELCNGRGICPGTDVNADNCANYNIYRKTLEEPKKPKEKKDTGKDKCKKNVPLPPSKCPDKKSELNIQNCKLAAYGELCEGDGECNTNKELDNCHLTESGKTVSYDIYVKCGDLQELKKEDCPKKKKKKTD